MRERNRALEREGNRERETNGVINIEGGNERGNSVYSLYY